MYHFKEKVDNACHDAFVKAHPMCNLLQSSNWAKVKENWKSNIISVYDKDEMIASASVLIKQLPLGFTMMYIPRGPIMDYTNNELVDFFFKQTKKWAKKYHCLFIKMDPGILKNRYPMQKHVDTLLDATKIAMQNLAHVGCIHQGYSLGFDDTIQPRFHAVVEQRNDFEETLPKTMKKALQTVRKKKIVVEAHHHEGIAAFANVMHLTEARKNIHLRDQEYFTTLMQIYGDDAVIYLAKLPLKDLLQESKLRLAEIEQALAACPENAKKKRFTLAEQIASLSREVKEFSESNEAAGEEVIISGALCIKFGPTSELLYAGMDDRYKRYMAPYASFLHCMLWSFEHNCTWCNMGGIEGNLKGGLSSFKANYDPLVYEFVGEFDLPVNSMLYKLSEFVYKIRKKNIRK